MYNLALNSYPFIDGKRQVLVDDGKDMPAFGNIAPRLATLDGSTDLSGNFFDRHHPK